MTDKHIPASKLLALIDSATDAINLSFAAELLVIKVDDLLALIDAETDTVEHPRYIEPDDFLPSDVRVAGGTVGKGCKFETLMTRIEAFNKYYDENLVDKALQVHMRKALLKSVEIVSAAPPADNLIAEKQATFDRLTEQRDRLLDALKDLESATRHFHPCQATMEKCTALIAEIEAKND